MNQSAIRSTTTLSAVSFKIQFLKPLACNSIKPRTISVKAWLSDALSRDLALGRSQPRPGSDALTQGLALGSFHPRPGSRTLSLKACLSDAFTPDLALGRFHPKTWLPDAFTQDLAPHVRTKSYNILILESLVMASITSLVNGPDFEYQPVSNNGEWGGTVIMILDEKVFHSGTCLML
jgi:hypothetical protein